VIALVCFFFARSMVVSRPRFLGQTIAELKRDVEGFQSAIKSEEPHR